jgi:hypothetical protein
MKITPRLKRYQVEQEAVLEIHSYLLTISHRSSDIPNHTLTSENVSGIGNNGNLGLGGLVLTPHRRL